MTNLGMEHALTTLGIDLLRANVGDRYVMEMLNEHNGILGGENSGHIICLDKTTTGDGIIAALQILAEMHYSGKTLHELKSGMQKYPQVLINVKVAKKVNFDDYPSVHAAVNAVESKLANKGRVLLRSSGTEPLLRVMVEGENKDLVQSCAEQLANEVHIAIGA